MGGWFAIKDDVRCIFTFTIEEVKNFECLAYWQSERKRVKGLSWHRSERRKIYKG
jgi:hypothetical protein